MKKLFGSSANSGSVVARMQQQAMQYAGKAEKTQDDEYMALSAQFKEAHDRAKGAEKILQLHYDAVTGIMGALENISAIAGELFSEQARGGYDIFAQASRAVNGDVIVVQPEQPTMATGGDDAQGADELQEKAKQVGALVGKGVKLGVKMAQEQLQGGHRDPPRTECARTKFVQAYEEKIWKPVKQYNTDMEILSSKRQQRNSLRLDYDAAFRVAQGYAKKPPRDPLKKQKADQAKETTEVLFNMVNQEVSSRMKFFVDGRVKFWSGILKAVLELEALSGMAVNKATVPFIKQLAAWIESGVPAAHIPEGPRGALSEAAAVPEGAPFGAQPTFGAPAPAPAQAAFGGPPPIAVPQPAPQPAPAAPTPAPASADPWDNMFSASAAPDTGGGSAI